MSSKPTHEVCLVPHFKTELSIYHTKLAGAIFGSDRSSSKRIETTRGRLVTFVYKFVRGRAQRAGLLVSRQGIPPGGGRATRRFQVRRDDDLHEEEGARKLSRTASGCFRVDDHDAAQHTASSASSTCNVEAGATAETVGVVTRSPQCTVVRATLLMSNVKSHT